MSKKFPFFAYLSITIVILLYVIGHLLFQSPAIKGIRIHSDSKQITSDLSQFLKANKSTPKYIVDNALVMFPELENIVVKNDRGGTLDIWLKHKKIVAIWTDGKYFYPLPDNGIPVMNPFSKRPKTGIVFAGKVPHEIASIIRAISSYPELVTNTDYIEFVEDRRWNIILKTGSVIKLPEPEQDIERTIYRIKQLGALHKTFSELDLRDSKRTLLK